MKKIKILIPVYNDWESLNKLLNEINFVIEKFDHIEFHCIVINDASTISCPEIKMPPKIKSLEIIDMEKNQGHARCIAFGIRHLSQREDFDYLILMDGDGEDRPEEIKLLVEKAFTHKNTSIVAKRIKRSEGVFFKTLYELHKLLTLIFTGKKVNFGNYSCLTRKDIKNLANQKSLWSSFSGSVKFHISQLETINSIRGSRYFGPSKMSFLNLIIHSLAIIAVFKRAVFFRSILLVFILFFLNKNSCLPYDGSFLILSSIILGIFNLTVFLISLRENEKQLVNSKNNVLGSKTYTQ